MAHKEPNAVKPGPTLQFLLDFIQKINPELSPVCEAHTYQELYTVHRLPPPRCIRVKGRWYQIDFNPTGGPDDYAFYTPDNGLTARHAPSEVETGDKLWWNVTTTGHLLTNRARFTLSVSLNPVVKQRERDHRKEWLKKQEKL